MDNQKIFQMPFSAIWPLLEQKALRKYSGSVVKTKI